MGAIFDVKANDGTLLADGFHLLHLFDSDVRIGLITGFLVDDFGTAVGSLWRAGLGGTAVLAPVLL